LSTGSNFSVPYLLKNKLLNYFKFRETYGYKNGKNMNLFSLLFVVVGSGIEKIRIRDKNSRSRNSGLETFLFWTERINTTTSNEQCRVPGCGHTRNLPHGSKEGERRDGKSWNFLQPEKQVKKIASLKV
jgi:hypothetical protein